MFFMFGCVSYSGKKRGWRRPISIFNPSISLKKIYKNELFLILEFLHIVKSKTYISWFSTTKRKLLKSSLNISHRWRTLLWVYVR